MFRSRRKSAWAVLAVGAVAALLLVSSTHATAEPSDATTSGFSCPVSGARGKSTLSLEEVMRRAHQRGGACPHAAAATRGVCPHGRSLTVPSVDKPGMWL
jgi:hypothetical protein